MKYQRLVSSTTPSSLQDWLGQELEDRGIDSVYARSILSLLQQDYVDIEPHECQHARSRQQKVLQKYSGPGKSFYATKSKHQKWRTREMQILLTSTYPCCNAVLPDIEKLKKKAAVDCLRSASDYINDIEELIDEVWIKLKNIKNLKGEKEDRALRKIMDPFFIPPSSPTDEIEKYFAAFPPLNGKTEAETVVDQHKISKNAWCKRCVLKRKTDVQNEAIHDSSNAISRSSSKCTQPIIPYSSLKTIKNVYKNDNTVYEIPNKHEETISFSKLNINVSKKHKAKKSIICKIMAWGAKNSAKQSLQFPLKNLSSISIYQFTMKKSHFIDLLHHTTFQNLATTLSNVECTDALLTFVTGLNCISDYTYIKALLYDTKENKCAPSILSHLEDVSEIDIFTNDLSSMKVSTCLALECDETKKPNSTSLDDHFKMSPLSDLWEYSENPQLDITQSLLSSLSLNANTSACSYTENEDMSFKNMLDFINEAGSIHPKNEICSTLKESLLSYNEQNGLGMDVSLWERGNSAFHTLPEKNLIQEFEKDYELACSEMKINEEVYNINILNALSHEEKNKFPEIMPSNKEIIHSDEEIFYSDDDSNEIFHSDEEENLFTSFKTHFQPIKISCSSMPDVNPEVSVYTREASYSLTDETSFQCQFEVDPENNAVLENKEIFSNCDNENEKFLKNALSIDRVITDTKTKTGSLSSSCEELASLAQFKLEKICDRNNACEQKYQYEASQKLRDKGTNTENLSQFSALTGIEQKESNFTSNKQQNSEGVVQDNLETGNKMWLFHWGDNHSFIARTWQKDNYSPTLGQQNDKMSYNSEVITALSKEIKEDGEELLKGLCSMSDIPNDTVKQEREESAENYLHSNPMDMYFQHGISINKTDEVLNLAKKESNDESLDNISSKLSTSFVDTAFTLDNINSNLSENEISQVYNLCSSFYESDKCLDTRTIQCPFASNRSHKKDNYLEGGGWSLASDNFSDYACESICERASSLGELDLEKSEAGLCELYPQNERLRCTSETNEETNQTGRKLALNLLQKRAKQKYAPRRRPCCFFLQGNCTRTDCRFSHDLSTTTCRFWKEGSCFKGETCPFLHGYVSENDQEIHMSDQCLEEDNLDNSYSLESESDFPSLSSVKTQASKGKSAAVTIEVKGSKKNNERKLLK